MSEKVKAKVNPRRRFTDPDTGITHEGGTIVEVDPALLDTDEYRGTLKAYRDAAPPITDIPVGDGPPPGQGENGDGDEAPENAGDGDGDESDTEPADGDGDASTDEETGEADDGGDGATDDEEVTS